MIRSLYTAVSGLITQEAKQDVITNNLANINTTAYKSEDITIKKFKDVLIQNKDKVDGGRNVSQEIGTLSLGARIDETVLDFKQGILKNTGKTTDFAIEGKGFFVVQKGNENFYTRDGSFLIDLNGGLITSTGEKVMGKNLQTGAVEQIIVGNSKISTGEDNSILLDGTPKYKLQTADFQSYDKLKNVGNNLFIGNNPNLNARVGAKQGYLERSNVNVVKEMIDLMTTMRSFESNQKIVQTIDGTLGKAANEVGSVR